MKYGICAATLLAIAGSTAHAQTASAQIREDDLLGGENVNSISNSAVNGVGGWAFTIVTEEAATISRIFGNLSGGGGSVLRSESTIGDFEQTSFESFFGIGNSSIGYGTTATRLSDGTTGLDGVWKDDTAVQTEEDPIGATEFSSFNSRPNMTHDNKLVWVGGLTNTVGGGSLDRGLFIDGNIVLRGGDVVPGIAEPVTVGSGIDFDFRVSELGTNWFSPIDFQASSTIDLAMVLNGNAYMAGGSVVREGSPLPASVGGLAGENWDNFDFVGITEAGDTFFTGDTDASSSMDEFVYQNGQIVLREGDTVDGMVLDGAIEGGYQNANADWAVIWDVQAPGSDLEALIVNGELILKEGDAVDWNGDGLIDALDMGATIDNFTGLSSLTLGDRQADGSFIAAFTADVRLSDDSVLEGGFLITIPAPGSAVALGAIGLAGLRRRR